MTATQQAMLVFTEVHLLKSKEIGQDFVVSIALPPSYFDQREQDYPVVYLIDADWYFGMFTETVRIMHRCDSFPEVIVVGISYPHNEHSLEQAFRETNRLCARDLTSVKDENAEKDIIEWLQRNDITTGSSNLFLRFIEDHLMPFIENQYRTNTANKTIVSHSFGGLFVLFALFYQTHLSTTILLPAHP